MQCNVSNTVNKYGVTSVVYCADCGFAVAVVVTFAAMCVR